MPLSILSSSARSTIARVVYKRASNVPATAGFYNINNTSLLYYYPFDTNFTNSNGNVNDLSYNGVSITTNYTVLTSGSSTMPQSSAQYIKLPNTLAFQSNQGITISCWYKLNSLSPATGNYARIFDIGDRSGAASNAFLLLFNGTTSNLYMGYYNNSLNISTPNLYTLDTNWHHLTVTIDTLGNFTLYVDGVSYGTYYLGLPPAVTYSNALIGGANDNAGYMNANMNNFMMFNRVLTPVEIGFLYKYPTLITVTTYATTTPPIDYPTSIPGCFLWLDAADKTTLQLVSGSSTNVAQWTDKSGFANNFTSVTNTPKTGTKTINGYNALDFTTASYVSSSTISVGTTYSMFFVAYTTANINDPVLMRGGLVGGSTPARIDVRHVTYTNPKGWSCFVGNGTFNSDALPYNDPAKSIYSTTGPYLIGLTNDGSTYGLKPYINGTPQTPKLGSNASCTGLIIGTVNSGAVTTNAWLGYVCEVIMYNNVLSNNDRQTIEGYLAWKWGIQTTATQSSIPLTLTAANPSNTFFWLDPTDLNTITTSGGTVTQWTDKSPNAYVMTATGSPKAYNAFINNYAVMDISTTALSYFSNTTIPWPSSGTVFALGKLNSTLNPHDYQTLIRCHSPANALYLQREDAGLYNIRYAYDADSIYWDTSANPFVNNLFCLTYVNATYTYSGSINGNALPTLTGTSVSPQLLGTGIDIGINPNFIGQSWKGYVGEIVIYSGVLSNNTRMAVEGYLAWKWGTHLLLPTTHNYYINSLPITHPYFKSSPNVALQTPTWWYKYLSTDIQLTGSTYYVKNYATNAYDASLNVNGANGYTGNYLTGMGVDPYNGLGTLTTSMNFGNGTAKTNSINNQWIQWPTLDTTSNYFTLTFMFKLKSLANSVSLLLLSPASLSAGLFIYYNQPTNCLVINFRSSNYSLSSITCDLNPHLLTITFGPKGYVPQVYYDTTNLTTSFVPSSDTTIASNIRGFNFDDWDTSLSNVFYNGWLGETRLYNYAMSANEVQTLYNSMATIYNINNTDLLRYYPFDGNMLDYSTGVGVTDVSLNSGVFLTTAATKLTTGAFNFQSVFAPTFALQPILFKPTGLTIAFWIKPNTTQETIYGRIFSFRQGMAGVPVTGSHDVVLNWANSSTPYNLLTFSYNTGPSNGVNNYITTTTALDTNWHHICITMTTTGLMSIYIDNVLNVTKASSNASFIDTSLPYNNFFLGKDTSTDTTYFTSAYMNSFVVFNRVLTLSEIGYLYGAPKQIQFTSAPTTNNVTFGTLTQPWANFGNYALTGLATNGTYMIKCYTNSGTLQYATYSGGAWGSFSNIVATTRNYNACAINAAGTRVVAGVNNGSLYLYTGTNFGTETLIDSTSRGYSAIAMPPDGSRIVVNNYSSGTGVYFSDWNGSTYPTPFTATSALASSGIFTIAITADKNKIIFNDLTSIYFATWNGTTYANATKFYTSSTNNLRELSFLKPDGSIFLQGTQVSSGSDPVYYSVWNGTTYNTLQSVNVMQQKIVSWDQSPFAVDYSNNIIYTSNANAASATIGATIYSFSSYILTTTPPVTINNITTAPGNVYATGQSVSDGITYNVYSFTSPTTTGQTGYTINYTCNTPTYCYMLAVGGGGSGCCNSGGGGGAGGVIMMPVALTAGTNTITISVGAGGASLANTGTSGNNGYNTQVTFNSSNKTYTAWGGGGGGYGNSPAGIGGSGGGGGTSSGQVYAGGASQNYGYNYGNQGGTGIATTGSPSNNGSNGGGGGAGTIGYPGALGTATNAQNGGNGGNGIQCFLPGVRDYLITSSTYPAGIKVCNLYWGGGGGGGAANSPSSAGNGGLGGGGGGSNYNASSSTTYNGFGGTGGLNIGFNGGFGNTAPGGNAGNAGANTGSGGGASYGYLGTPVAASGAGGSGIVILAFPASTLSTSTSTTVLTNPTLTTDSYTTSRCIFGCKLLNSNYYGPIMTLRYEGDTSGNQQNFYSDICGNLGTSYNGTGQSVYSWLLANGITSTAAASSPSAYAYVTKWYDQGMDFSFNSAIQTATGSQPIYDISKGFINFGYTTNSAGPAGWPSNAGNAYLNLPNPFPFPSGAISVSVVFKYNNVATFSSGTIYTGIFEVGCSNIPNAVLGLIDIGATNYNKFSWYGANYGNTTYAQNSVMSMTYVAGSNSMYIFKNGTADTGNPITTGTQSFSNTAGNAYDVIGYVYNGNFNYFNGQLYYFYLFNTSLTTADRTILESTPTSFSWANIFIVTLSSFTTTSFTATWSYSGTSTYTMYINNNLYGTVVSGGTFYPNIPQPWKITIFAYNSSGTLLAVGYASVIYSIISIANFSNYYTFDTDFNNFALATPSSDGTSTNSPTISNSISRVGGGSYTATNGTSSFFSASPFTVSASPTANSGYSFAFWARGTTGFNGVDLFKSAYNSIGNNSNYISLWIKSGTTNLSFGYTGGSSVNPITSPAYINIQPYIWYHYVVTIQYVNSTTIVLYVYVNGSQVYTNTCSNWMTAGSWYTTFGGVDGSVSSPAFVMNGNIDDARIYSRVISAAEVAILANYVN
jgi:Concanavalin A-like lectin/glucanases superfamily